MRHRLAALVDSHVCKTIEWCVNSIFDHVTDMLMLELENWKKNSIILKHLLKTDSYTKL